MAVEEAYESRSSTCSTKVLVTAQLIAPIEAALASKSTPLPERFRAVFTLKNLGGPLAIRALTTGELLVLMVVCRREG